MWRSILHAARSFSGCSASCDFSGFFHELDFVDIPNISIDIRSIPLENIPGWLAHPTCYCPLSASDRFSGFKAVPESNVPVICPGEFATQCVANWGFILRSHPANCSHSSLRNRSFFSSNQSFGQLFSGMNGFVRLRSLAGLSFPARQGLQCHSASFLLPGSIFTEVFP